MPRRSLNSWLLATTLLALMAAPVPAQIVNLVPTSTAVKNFKPVTDAMLLKPDPAIGFCGGAPTMHGATARSIRSTRAMSRICRSHGPGRSRRRHRDDPHRARWRALHLQLCRQGAGAQCGDRRPDLAICPRAAGQACDRGWPNARQAKHGDLSGQAVRGTSDAHIVALDAVTGKVVWDHATGDWTQGWRYTGAR